jgi:hypothetical protein
MSKTVKDLLIALSLANLCFISGWRVLLNPNRYTYYHWKFHPGFIEVAALVLNVVILGALLWGAMTLVRRLGKPWLVEAARWALLLSLLIPLNNLRLYFFDPLNPDVAASPQTIRLGYAVFLIPFAALVFLAFVLKRRRSQILRGAAVALLILFPFFVITGLQGAWMIFKYRGFAELAAREPRAAPLNSNRPEAPRVAWIIFDELDYQMTFDKRPPGLELKEFDRLRGESLFASNAYVPARRTLLSMPALIIGRPVSDAWYGNPSELTLTLKDGQKVDWSTQPSVFTKARAEGFDTALVGWYHPYCRVIGGSITSCFWQPVVDAVNPLRGKPTLSKSMYYWAETALFAVPGMFRIFQPRYESERCDAHIEEYQQIMDQAKSAAGKKEFGLTLLHFPIPHNPFIYNRDQGTFSSEPDRTYEDNLVLADKTLGEIRRVMEAAGLWESTTVIVSSDHNWRANPRGSTDERVPFVMKLAGQKQPVMYHSKVNTVVSLELIHGLLKKELTNPDNLVEWLDSKQAAN